MALLCEISLHSSSDPALHYTTLHCSTLHCTTLHYTTLHYTTLHYTTLQYTTLHYTTLHCTTLHYTTLHYTTLHYTTLHYTALHYTTLHHITLSYTRLYLYRLGCCFVRPMLESPHFPHNIFALLGMPSSPQAVNILVLVYRTVVITIVVITHDGPENQKPHTALSPPYPLPVYCVL